MKYVPDTNLDADDMAKNSFEKEEDPYDLDFIVQERNKKVRVLLNTQK